MQSAPAVDLRWLATLVVPIGSGWLTLHPPDQVAGGGTMVATSWTVQTSGDHLAVVVGENPVGDTPAKATAAGLRDALLTLPCYVPNPTITQDGQLYRFEGRLSPGGGNDLARLLTGTVIPFQPVGEIRLAIDARSKLWQALDVHLFWPLIDVNLLGHQISWGPGGHLSFLFGDNTGTANAVRASQAPQKPSTAELGLNGLAGSASLQSLSAPPDLLFRVLDVRRTAAMVDDEPRWRAALLTAGQRGQPSAPEYQAALRSYRSWEHGIPLVGPLLGFVFPDSAP